MYKLKQIPSDFIVEEINKDLKLNESGNYSTYKLTKKEYNTVDAIRRISDKWNIPIKFFNFAGTKDRNAITYQYITISKGPRKDLELKDLKLEYLGQREERLNLGNLDGNKFIITIRNIDQKPKTISSMPNYFDSQRFGRDDNNDVVGKLIIEKEFQKAEELIGEKIEKLPKNIAKMYVHAYQSRLFNDMLKKRIGKVENSKFEDFLFPKNKLENENLPLIGFGTEETEEVEEILEKEDITLRDFIIRRHSYLSSEGESRNSFIEIKKLKVDEIEDDYLNEGKKKCKVEFILPSGSYATIAIKAMLAR
ncbi:hypothetical protein C0585_00485 [Candidatus Woesearchaeota archaeon]|nr:MAG: hypothetical protein C0585_00485 [Candidatus Woesearchaeota archaeon]